MTTEPFEQSQDVWVVTVVAPQLGTTDVVVAVCRTLRMAESVMDRQQNMDRASKVQRTYQLTRRPLL
jgi:hypothetical protein